MFKPNCSTSPNDRADEESVLSLRILLKGSATKCYISEGDKTANIDGHIELLQDDRPCGDITIQVKTYPRKYQDEGKYDIPTSLLGYAQNNPLEVVILLVVDNQNRKVYWKYISPEFIIAQYKKNNQKTITYHFENSEVLTKENKDDVVKKWKEIYSSEADKRNTLINQIKRDIKYFEDTFQVVTPYFFGLPLSFITRKEIGILYDWIQEKDSQNNISILTGKAGMGKSVVIQQLLERLKENKVPVLAIKADVAKIYDRDIFMAINNAIKYMLTQTTIPVVLLIDQIDALSLSLSKDRELINEYFRIINKFSRNDNAGRVKIIVSCRTFDLSYDATLSQLKHNKNVELQELSIEEVKGILTQIMDKKEIRYVSDETIQLLRTPQYLDTYCRIYDKEQSVMNFANPQNLYEELWRIQVIHSTVSERNELECLIYKIAERIQKEETLATKWIISAEEMPFIEYLSTQGIVTYENHTIRFFHQSFYDYVLARKFVSDQKSLSEWILSKHQGLFIRGTIRQVFSYLRNYDEPLYDIELKACLFLPEMRYHIKLLILQDMAVLENPTIHEKNIISHAMRNDKELFETFLKQSISANWIDFLLPKMQREIINITDIEAANNKIITSSLIQFTSKRSILVFDLIEKIKNDDVREKIAERALFFTENHSSPKIITWYHYFRQKTERNNVYDFFLEKAINDNPTFVCTELERILLEAVTYWTRGEEYIKMDPHHLFDTILKTMIDRYPMMMYPVLKKIVKTLIDGTRYEYSSPIQSNRIFNSWNIDSNCEKLIEWLTSILKDRIGLDALWVENEIKEFLDSKDDTLFQIALKIMLLTPQRFNNIIFSFFKDHALIEHLLDNDYEGYYFRILLEKTYSYFTNKQKGFIEQYILNFKSDKDRQRGNSYYKLKLPYLGYLQRSLIYCLPQNSLSQQLRKKRDELDRRLPWKYENKLHDRHVLVGSRCSGLVSSETYEKFTLKNWETSLLKCREDYNYRKAKFMFFDRHSHIREFKKCVAKYPHKFHPFILELFENAELDIDCKLAGLQGLLEADYNFKDAYELFLKLKESTNDERNLYELIEIAKLLLKHDSVYVNDVADYLLSIIRRDYKTTYTVEIEQEKGDNLDLLNKGLNTIQGRAIRALIEACGLEGKSEMVYFKLMGISPILAIEHKLVILYYLSHEGFFDEKYFEQLLSAYLNEANESEYAIANINLLNYYLYNKPEMVMTYITRITTFPRAQNALAQLLYLGTVYGIDECKQLLDKKLEKCDGEFLSGCLKIAFKNFSDPRCNALSFNIIDRLSNMLDDSVQEEFRWSFHQLTSDDFCQIMPILIRIIPKIGKNKTHSILSYLEKCIPEYPVESYNCLDKLIRENTLEKTSYDIKEELELLFAIYRYLKNTDKDISERIMDTFDHLLKTSQSHYGLEGLIKEIDKN